mgnify:CR=1 FL=1
MTGAQCYIVVAPAMQMFLEYQVLLSRAHLLPPRYCRYGAFPLQALVAVYMYRCLS